MEKEGIFAVLIVLIAVFLCAVPLIKNGYLGSADSMHTSMARIIVEKGMQDTYEPYANVSFTYPSAIFYSWLAPIITVMPFRDYFSLALIGLVFVAIEFALFYILTLKLFENKRIALMALALLATTKFLYQDYYFGLFPRLAATCFFFAFFIAYLSKWNLSKWKYKYLAMLAFMVLATLSHPAYAVFCFGFFFLYVLLGKKETRQSPPIELFLVWIAVLVGCALTGSGLTLFNAGSNPISFSFEFGRAISSFLGMGVILALFYVGAIVFSSKSRITPFFVLSVLFFIALTVVNHLSINVALTFLTLSGIWFVCEMASEDFKRWDLVGIGVVLIIGATFSFFAGGYLLSLINGTKISPEGAQFAELFYELDSEPKTVLFLTKGSEGTKIAEFANKIPLDVSTGWFVPKGSLVKDDSEVWERKARQERIERGEECIANKFDYIVIDVYEYELLKKEPILVFNKFRLYSGDST